MTELNGPVARMRALPLHERAEELERLVVAEFRQTLLMADDEPLPLDESYFDLGFTSLRISEIKDRLEGLLGCEISTNTLFNSPTIAQLLAHLTDEAMPWLFDRERPDDRAQTRAAEQNMVDDLLTELYQP